jgi:hypothetical protein
MLDTTDALESTPATLFDIIITSESVLISDVSPISISTITEQLNSTSESIVTPEPITEVEITIISEFNNMTFETVTSLDLTSTTEGTNTISCM